MGFAVFAVPAWLAEAGMTTADIGMVSATTMLPWAFKVVWAPLVDRFKYRAMGRFRAWIIGAQLGLMASTVALVSLPSPLTHVRALAGTLFAQALFASMSDVAGDGLAVEVLPSGERGLANAVMSGAQAAGNVIGGAGLSAVLAIAGFRAAAGLSLLLLSVACAPTVLLRERPGERLLPWTRGAPSLVAADRAPLALAGSVRLLARSVFARASAQALVTWIAVYFLSGCLGILMTAAAVRHYGFRPAEYASLGALALAPNLIGAFAGGRLADRKGRAPVVAGALLLGAVSWAAFGLLPPSGRSRGCGSSRRSPRGRQWGALHRSDGPLHGPRRAPRRRHTVRPLHGAGQPRLGARASLGGSAGGALPAREACARGGGRARRARPLDDEVTGDFAPIRDSVNGQHGARHTWSQLARDDGCVCAFPRRML